MDGYGDLLFLVKNDFTKLVFELQMKIKQNSRPTLKLDLSEGRAMGKAGSLCGGNDARMAYGKHEIKSAFLLAFDWTSCSLNNPWSTTGFVDLAKISALHVCSRTLSLF